MHYEGCRVQNNSTANMFTLRFGTWVEWRDLADWHRCGENQFVRERILPLPRVVLLLLNLVQGALQAERDRFFEGSARSEHDLASSQVRPP